MRWAGSGAVARRAAVGAVAPALAQVEPRLQRLRAARARLAYETWYGIHLYVYIAMALGFTALWKATDRFARRREAQPLDPLGVGPKSQDFGKTLADCALLLAIACEVDLGDRKSVV